MVILKSTERAQKNMGYESAAKMFDEKIDNLNNRNRAIQEKITNSILKKEQAIEKIEKIIGKLEKVMNSEETQHEILTLIAFKKAFEEDITDFKALKFEQVVPISNILQTSSIEGITNTIKMLNKKE